jgi:hypothetical protein
MLLEILVNIIWKTLSQEPFDHKTFVYDFPTHTWKKPPIRTLYSVCTVVLIGRFWSMIAKLFKQKGGTKIPRLGSGLWVYDTILNNIKWLTMFFKTRWRFSAISHRRVKPLRWKMTEKRPQVLKNIFKYFIAMILCFIKDLVKWRHYNVILENNDITTCVLDNG